MKWEKVFRQGLTAFLTAIFLLSAAIVSAAIEIFDGAGQYIMSDFENHDIAKQRAQQRAERDAQKKAGVTLKTFSRSINSELTDDEISAVTNNIIKVSDVNIMPVPFETNGEAGIMYRATLKATIDTDGIYAWIKRDEKEKVIILNQNNDLQDAIAKNDKQVEDLKEKYNRATSQSEKERIIKQMTDADRDFLASKKLKEGLKLFYLIDSKGAIRLYNEALKLKPDYAEAYYNRGIAYSVSFQNKRAIQDFNKAIQLNPNYAEAYNNRGWSYDMLGQHERGIQDLDKAIQLNPNYADAYYNRGVVYFRIGNYQQGIADATKVIQINPDYIPAYELRGFSYQQLGEETKGKADLAKAKELRNKGRRS